ncbi:MAG: hypothetical protein IJL17_14325 [Kiritimatiellae bacterium]|nr:hypothetical protein [Kiritimatiellia bacterium]
MTEPDENNEELETPAAAGTAEAEALAAAENLADADAEEEAGTIIRDTDIVFDCPHCGHNLAIDYRGAGLQIECVNCGESVLVPIPDGMKIDDLDIEPGEILKQLFAARRNLQRAEGRIEELELELRGVTMRRDTLRALLESFAIQLEEMKELARNEGKLREKSVSLVNRLAGDIEATIGDAAHGGMLDEDGGDVADSE